MKFQSLVSLAFLGVASARSIHLPRDVASAGIDQAGFATLDAPAVKNALNQLSGGIVAASKALGGITEANAAEALAQFESAGKNINSALTEAAATLSASPPLAFGTMRTLLKPIMTFVGDLVVQARTTKGALPAAAKTKGGKAGIAKLIREMEPGLKSFTLASVTQVPEKVTAVAGVFGIKPPTGAEVDKAMAVVNRGLDIYLEGGFDRVIASHAEIRAATKDLLTSGTFDKMLGVEAGSTEKKLKGLHAKLTKGFEDLRDSLP